jgi:hypothetical protein
MQKIILARLDHWLYGINADDPNSINKYLRIADVLKETAHKTLRKKDAEEIIPIATVASKILKNIATYHFGDEVCPHCLESITCEEKLYKIVSALRHTIEKQSAKEEIVDEFEGPQPDSTSDSGDRSKPNYLY